MIKLIIFDLGDIFYDTHLHSRLFEAEFKNFLKKYDVKRNMMEIDRLWDYLHPLASNGRITAKEAHGIQLKHMGLAKRLLPEFSSIEYRTFSKVALKESSMPKTLRLLKKKGYRLAILSDSIVTTREVMLRLKRLGIAEFFDGVFTSSGIGYAKPDRKSYRTVMKAFKVKPFETIFVAHDKDELAGAKKLGIKSVSYLGVKFGDYYMRKFPELLEVLAKLGQFQ
ncbi:MAG: HAD-IA family hydrolase [Candidatus Micrarchaeota archaeon]|nr:HAD-IA family hydrolase [Candidatus Micrarchaeota archaeon]